MNTIYLISYAVKGIKNIDQWARLSFYKKVITKDFSSEGYNVKGIYGANGAGKSAIISSVSILKQLILNSSYLNNPVVQKQLDALVNKHLGTLEIEAEFVVPFSTHPMKLYHYQILVKKDHTGQFCITSESLEYTSATSYTHAFTPIYRIEDGIISYLGKEDDDLSKKLREKSINLLSYSSLISLLLPKIYPEFRRTLFDYPLAFDMIALFFFGNSLFVYLDNGDDHTDYIVDSIVYNSENDDNRIDLQTALQYKNAIKESSQILSRNDEYLVPKTIYHSFEQQVEQLHTFLHIFKPELLHVFIDRKEDSDFFRCRLIMKYQDYSINSEFESTGIKKLIRLFDYLKKAADGEIVFIDELDSNLHDVYLCALLEYLMDYGKGQLCFTTHNIGPMDILKKSKKSIDFLSVDHTIYSWTTNGNYSPSKLYKSGMIEGSPFNVDEIDFIAAFYSPDKEDGGQ